MNPNNDKFYIIRGDRSGVFFGKIKERNGREVTLTDCRRLWYWDGAASLSQLAVDWTKRPENCKFTVTVPEITVLDAIEVIPCSDCEPVYQIDGIQTIIRTLRRNVAKGAILNSDFTTTPCFVVKQNEKFAHGDTIREAMEALTDKLFDGMSEDERISAFMEAHQWGKEYPNQDLYAWHHRLTGSCDMGRQTFAQEHGIDVEHGAMTVEAFIALTRNAYGSATIRKLEAAYKERGAPHAS